MSVSVNDPFLLASFSSTTHHHQQQQAVSCSPEERDITPADQDDDAGLLVVAIQGEGIQLYNTADQKCILSYSTPPGYSFAGSAQTLYKSTLRHVYAVVAKGTDITAKDEGKVVWMWKEELSTPSSVAAAADSDMAVDTVTSSSAQKSVHKFDHKIHQLFVSALLPNHIILANEDASISLVAGDLKRVINTKELLTPTTTTTKPGKKDKKDTTTAQDKSGNLIWATSFSTTRSWIPSNVLARQILIIMTIVESGNGKLTVTLSYVNEEHRGFSTLGAVEIETAAGASGFAFDVKTGQLSFLTTDGHLKVYIFEVTQGDHVVSTRETLTLPLPGYAAKTAPAPAPTVKAGKKGSKAATVMDSKVQRVDAVALGDNYLAIAGIHQSNDKAEHTLTIWDIQYGTLQAKHVVPGSFTAQNTTCQLALLPDSTLVMTISTLLNTTIKSEVFLCPFYAEPMSLLGAMGKMKDTAPFLGQQGSMLAQDAYTSTTTSLLAPSGSVAVLKGKDLMKAGADLDKQMEISQSAEREALALLASESRTSTVQAFEQVFFKHVEHQTAEAVSDMMAKHKVDPEKAKEAASQAAAASQDMEVDTEPVVKAKVDGETKLSKKKQKAAKAAAKEAKEAKEVKEAKKAATEEADEGSSSESSSDEDEEDEEVVVLSSDEEANEEADVEEEDEYEVDEFEERSKREATLKAVEAWRKIEATKVKKYKGDRRLLRAGRKPTPLPELSHHFLTTVVGRCFTQLGNGQPDMTFWPGTVVEYLIKNQLVGNSNPGAGQGGIALGLMEREQWALLELALQKLYDIPEMDMVVMMKQVIGLNKKSLATTTTAAAKTSTSVPNVASFLNTIMVAPRNEVFMQQAIKRLTVEELAIVLEILRDWISIWDQRGGVGHQNQRPDKKQLPGGLPGYGLLVDFTTLILDVHFPSLILSPHLHSLLKSIQESIQREAEASSQLEYNLRGALGLFDRKHQETMRRRKDTPFGGLAVAAANGATAGTAVAGAGGLGGDKRRRRKFDGGEGIPEYAVEIIHL
ncbi:hypothetical protein BGX29_008477 [Mortierella sp. GBA35]|nr:hypothetical protein BGX29_008477 [Mortierella sp. GBA35]